MKRKTGSRNTRINEEVKRELSQIIRELKDPRIHIMTSVMDVMVTNDLKYCKASISVLGNDEAKQDTLKGLNSGVGFIRSELAKRINLRNTPELQFVMDDSIEYSVKISKLIDSVVPEEEEEGSQDDA